MIINHNCCIKLVPLVIFYFTMFVKFSYLDYSGYRASQGLFSMVASWSDLAERIRAYTSMLALCSTVLLKNTRNHCGVTAYTK